MCMRSRLLAVLCLLMVPSVWIHAQVSKVSSEDIMDAAFDGACVQMQALAFPRTQAAKGL